MTKFPFSFDFISAFLFVCVFFDPVAFIGCTGSLLFLFLYCFS